MTEAQHTPGPWSLDDKTGAITWGNVGYGAPIGSGGFVVSSHSISRIPNHQSERLTDEHRANAFLTVAAPDMLAALELAERTISTTLTARGYKAGECTDSWSREVRGEVAALVHIQNAIAKAKGKPCAEMTDEQLYAELEKLGFVKEFNGGGTFVYANGNVIVSGADCDLPSPHWYCVAVYQDWEGGDLDCDWSRFDYSGVPDYADMGEGPRDIMADVREALAIQSNSTPTTEKP